MIDIPSLDSGLPVLNSSGPLSSERTRFPTRFSRLGPFSHLSLPFVSRLNRLWTRLYPIYPHHSMGQSLPQYIGQHQQIVESPAIEYIALPNW